MIFAVLGTLLFLGKRWVGPDLHHAAALMVVVDVEASPAEVERATNEALLLSFATRAGFARSDLAVRDRLVRNVRFVDESLTAQQALTEAFRLQMHHTDPVVRQRLLWIATQTLAAATRSEPSDEVLRRYMHANEARFLRPPRLSFEQVFVSRERHAGGFSARVQWVSERLEAGLSDPSLLPRSMTRASAARIDARFGEGFAERLFTVKGQGWSRAIPSSFGAHYVRILGRTSGGLPELEDVRARVRYEFERDSEPMRVRAALRRMREAYRIVIERHS